MIKCNKSSMTISGTATELAAEGACMIKHLILEMAKHDKNSAIAAFITFGEAMADAGEELHKKYKVPLDVLNGDFLKDDEDDEEDEDEDELGSLLESLKDVVSELPRDFKEWLMEELDTDDEEDD